MADGDPKWGAIWFVVIIASIALGIYKGVWTGIGAFVLFTVGRALIINYRASEARIQQKKAELSEREGRDGSRHLNYEQQKDEEAFAFLQRHRVTRWLLPGGKE